MLFEGKSAPEKFVEEHVKPALRIFPETPKELQTPFILIMKAMLVGWLAVLVAGLLGDVINKFVMARGPTKR